MTELKNHSCFVDSNIWIYAFNAKDQKAIRRMVLQDFEQLFPRYAWKDQSFKISYVDNVISSPSTGSFFFKNFSFLFLQIIYNNTLILPFNSPLSSACPISTLVSRSSTLSNLSSIRVSRESIF